MTSIQEAGVGVKNFVRTIGLQHNPLALIQATRRHGDPVIRNRIRNLARSRLLISKENVIVIPKASTDQHAIEDCGASGWRLSDAEYEELNTRVRFQQRGFLETAARRTVKHILQIFG